MKKSIIIFITFVFIAVSSVLTKQKFFIILPVFISLFINALQADANRYAYLVGSFNSLIYMGVSLYMELYASAASNLLFSFPVQLLTFIRWSKNSYGNSYDVGSGVSIRMGDEGYYYVSYDDIPKIKEYIAA